MRRDCPKLLASCWSGYANLCANWHGLDGQHWLTGSHRFVEREDRPWAVTGRTASRREGASIACQLEVAAAVPSLRGSLDVHDPDMTDIPSGPENTKSS
jgi:hypothetical protein